jgi:hypothetical protein
MILRNGRRGMNMLRGEVSFAVLLHYWDQLLLAFIQITLQTV